MSTNSTKHYLESELDTLLQTDPATLDFLRRGSLDGMWYWNLEDPADEWMSPEFWKLFGVDPATKKHCSDEWQELIFPDDQIVALDNFERHCSDPDYPYDQIVRYRHSDGSTVWVRCRGLAIRNELGVPVRMLGAHNDMTALKETEARLLYQVDQAAVANAELTSFAYAMSHDLRSPVNTLHMVLSEIAEELGDSANELVSKMLAQGLETANRASQLVEDVLAYARVVEEELRLEPVDLKSVAVDAVNDAASDVAAVNAKIEVGDLPAVRASPLQMQILIRNLLSNALKFRRLDAGQHVVKIAGRPSARNGYVQFSVADNGIGIAADQQRKIFEMFQRLNLRSEYPGSGLGLALCRRVILNHGGDIEVVSSVTDGAEFIITLPSAGIS